MNALQISLGKQRLVGTMAALSGATALSWEVIWQIQAALAVGISAWGTSLTLAITMAGMGCGALAMVRLLRERVPDQPLQIYGVLEIGIGICGLCLLPAFRLLTQLDTMSYGLNALPVSHVVGIAIILGLPALCMGATLPVLGLVAQHHGMRLSNLYGLNTLGAAAGTLTIALLLIPQLGIAASCFFLATINILLGLLALLLRRDATLTVVHEVALPEVSTLFTAGQMRMLAAVSGFVVFMLEIAWFRALTSAFLSTTDAFAIMLAVVLLALGFASWITPLVKRYGVKLGNVLLLGGLLVIIATVGVEHIYLFAPPYSIPAFTVLDRLIKTLLLIGPPVACLGMCLPWMLDEKHNPEGWSQLYLVNTIAAVLGAVAATWLLLPTIGLARTAWIAGALTIAAGIAVLPRASWRKTIGALTVLVILTTTQYMIGHPAVRGRVASGNNKSFSVLEKVEGPESAIAAIAYPDGSRALIVDGFVTAAQELDANAPSFVSYMAWMGHLPMLIHQNPRKALVICFGTGQTTNAVRRQNPEQVDVVDINPRIFTLAHYFDKNENVIDDPRVRLITMDGRAYMRRNQVMYDVITLEPMPPNFAGANALYSQEFYQLARQHLHQDGMIAQWIPFHVADPYAMASIVRTFQSVFANSLLWMDPTSHTGILIGSMDEHRDLLADWPGFQRNQAILPLSSEGLMNAVWLDRVGLQRYGAQAGIITDDNQLMAYGKAMNGVYGGEDYSDLSVAALHPYRRPGAGGAE